MGKLKLLLCVCFKKYIPSSLLNPRSTASYTSSLYIDLPNAYSMGLEKKQTRNTIVCCDMCRDRIGMLG